MRRYQGRRKSPLGCGIKIRQSEQNKWYDRICPICFVTSKGLFAGGILTTEWVVNFSLDAASVADMSAVQNMMQLYTHDFSEFWAGTPRGELGQDGRFPDYPIAPYFECPRWSASLFKIDDKPVGFALINDKGHSALPTEYSVGEFFIVRKYRGQGLGLIAAQRLFHRYPGPGKLPSPEKTRRRWYSGREQSGNVPLRAAFPNWTGTVLNGMAPSSGFAFAHRNAPEPEV